MLTVMEEHPNRMQYLSKSRMVSVVFKSIQDSWLILQVSRVLWWGRKKSTRREHG